LLDHVPGPPCVITSFYVSTRPIGATLNDATGPQHSLVTSSASQGLRTSKSFYTPAATTLLLIIVVSKVNMFNVSKSIPLTDRIPFRNFGMNSPHPGHSFLVNRMWPLLLISVFERTQHSAAHGVSHANPRQLG
jgi:hypothetical protein